MFKVLSLLLTTGLILIPGAQAADKIFGDGQVGNLIRSQGVEHLCAKRGIFLSGYRFYLGRGVPLPFRMGQNDRGGTCTVTFSGWGKNPQPL